MKAIPVSLNDLSKAGPEAFKQAAEQGTAVLISKEKYRLYLVKDGDILRKGNRKQVLSNLRQNLYWARPVNHGRLILVCSDQLAMP